MSIQARVVGGNKRREATVTDFGQLVTSPLSFSQFYNAATVSNNVPVNVIQPAKRQKFIITDIILSGDRSVGANGAVTTVYENNISGTDTTQQKVIITEEIAKQTRMVATGLNIEVTEGRWVNIVSDDVIVRCNIGGYYVTTTEVGTS
jgi:hypothetical protein